MKKQFFILAILTICSFSVFSQDKVLMDSLYRDVLKANQDTNKVKLYNRIAREYFANYRDNEAQIYWDSTLLLGMKINYEKGMASAYSNLSILYYYKANYDTSKYLIAKSMNINKKNNYIKELANNYINLGTVHDAMGFADSAFVEYKKALSIYEKHNIKEGIASVNQNIAIYYQEKGEYKRAEEYYLKSKNQYKEIESYNDISSVYQNLAILMKIQSKYYNAMEYLLEAKAIAEKSKNKKIEIAILSNIAGLYLDQNMYDKAKESYEEVIKQSELIQLDSEIAIAYMNIGGIYIQQEKYSEAEPYMKKALLKFEKIKVYQRIALCQIYLSKIYLKTNQFSKAENILNKAKIIVENIKQESVTIEFELVLGEMLTEQRLFFEAKKNFMSVIRKAEQNKNIYNQRSAYRGLYLMALKQKDFESAIKYKDKHEIYNDSIKQQLFDSRVLNAQSKYETAEKEKENQKLVFENIIQKEENAKIKARNVFVIIVFAILTVLFVGAFLFVQLRQKQRLSAQKIDINESIKQELAGYLHTDVGNKIIPIIYNLEEKNSDKKLSHEIAGIRDFYEEIRNKSHLLQMPDFADTDLNIEINNLIYRLEETSVTLNKDIDGTINWQKLAPKTQLNMYRILQELINNSLKYSKPHEIKIVAQKSGNSIELSFTDNGAGYNPEDITYGFGYKNEIIARTELLRAKFTDHSRVGRGAKLNFEIPLK